MSKPLANETEVYLQKAKQRASPTGQTLEKLNAFKDQEIEDALKDLELQKARKLLQDFRGGNTGMSAHAVASKLFEGKSIDEINIMLATLTPEAIENLGRLANSMDNNPVNALMRPQLQPQSGNELLLKYLLDKDKESKTPSAPQGFTVADVVAIIKLINEPKVAPAPVAPVASQQMGPMDVLKVLLEFTRPLQEQLKGKDKEIMDARLKEMEAKMPGSLDDQIEYIQKMAPLLGLSGKSTSELDLKLEEMRQNREVDMKRLDWEQKKWELETEADVSKWENIGKILQGPVGDVIKNVGSAGADRVRGGGKSPINANARMPKPVKTQCPNCNSVIYVDADADTALCGNCGAVLQKQSVGAAPAPSIQPAPPAQPEPTRVQQPPATETDTQQEEEETDEHSEEEPANAK